MRDKLTEAFQVIQWRVFPMGIQYKRVEWVWLVVGVVWVQLIFVSTSHQM